MVPVLLQPLQVLGEGDVTKQEGSSQPLSHRELMPEHLPPARRGSKGDPKAHRLRVAG